jgi:hypothetical protein
MTNVSIFNRCCADVYYEHENTWGEGLISRYEIIHEAYPPEFFITKSLIVMREMMGAYTVCLRLDGISEKGMIKMTDIQRGKPSDFRTLGGIARTFAIEIDKDSYPAGVDIAMRTAYTGR